LTSPSKLTPRAQSSGVPPFGTSSPFSSPNWPVGQFTAHYPAFRCRVGIRPRLSFRDGRGWIHSGCQTLGVLGDRRDPVSSPRTPVLCSGTTDSRSWLPLRPALYSDAPVAIGPLLTVSSFQGSRGTAEILSVLSFSSHRMTKMGSGPA
jgi:hypothetical protein